MRNRLFCLLLSAFLLFDQSKAFFVRAVTSPSLVTTTSASRPPRPGQTISIHRDHYHTKMNATPKGFPFVNFDNAPFWESQTIFFGTNLLGYVINLIKPHCHYHVDLLGTGAFGLAAVSSLIHPYPTTLTSLSSPNTRIQISAGLVLAWSIKLASFLFYRVIQSRNSKDDRLDAILSSPTRAAGFWLFSWAWGCLCSLPHTLGTTSSSAGSPTATALGGALAVSGWIIETLADYQKWMFKKKSKDSNTKETCIRSGLWSVSQHPNWFGNLLLWSGMFVLNAPALVEPLMFPSRASLWNKLWSYRRVGLAAVSPMFLWYLFYSQATGALLPDGLAATQKKYGYGVDPEYTKYIDSTPLIIPNPVSWWTRRNTGEAAGNQGKKAQ